MIKSMKMLLLVESMYFLFSTAAAAAASYEGVLIDVVDSLSEIGI